MPILKDDSGKKAKPFNVPKEVLAEVYDILIASYLRKTRKEIREKQVRQKPQMRKADLEHLALMDRCIAECEADPNRTRNYEILVRLREEFLARFRLGDDSEDAISPSTDEC